MFVVNKDLLNRVLNCFYDQVFLIGEESNWTFGEFFEESFLISETLDIKPHDHIPLLSENPEFFLKTFLGLWIKGAVAVPLNPNIHSKKKKQLLFKAGCKEYKLSKLKNGIKSLKSRKNIQTLHWIQRQKKNKKIIGKSDFSMNPCSWGTIMFTSGSSGSEKAVVHSIGNHLYNAFGANEAMPLDLGDRWLLSLPLYHVGGLAIFLRTLISGSTVVIAPKNQSLEETLKKYNITHISLVPTQLYRILQTKAGRDSLRKLKLILLGGSNIPSNLVEKSLQLGLNLRTTYGSTEMASQVATGTKECYKILPFREVRISSEGEIEVRGQTRFLGYYDGNKLLKPFDKNGWFKTGDFGVWITEKKVQEKNFVEFNDSLRILGRKDSMFISGGENIYPKEIEDVLYQSKMVEKAVVVSVIDIEYGKRPVVFLKYSGSFSESEVKKHLEKNLLRFKIPDLFLPWKESFEIGMKYKLKELSNLAQIKYDLLREKM